MPGDEETGSLADQQARFMACLERGPDHFPDGLFAQGRARALLGLRAHANTVSHARLTALEDSFPRLRTMWGHEAFHATSRDYAARTGGRTADMNGIGEGFAAFLSERDEDDALVDTARVEWAWLESYRAADADPLGLTEVAALDEAELMALAIAPHPALRVVPVRGPLPGELADLGAPAGVLIARPEADVSLHPLDVADLDLVAGIANIATLGNLLDRAVELVGESAAMERVIRIVQTGALTRDIPGGTKI